MADYITLKSSNENGNFSLNPKVFAEITEYSVPRIENCYLAKKVHDAVNVEYKNEELVITADIKIKKGVNIPKTVKALQERIHLNIEQTTDITPKEVNIRVVGYVVD